MIWPAGLDVRGFLEDYWQKRPLLLPGALPQFGAVIDGDELAGLACEAELESRIVQHDAADHWSLRTGPFDDSDFAALPERDWTLLVQDVDTEDVRDEIRFVTERKPTKDEMRSLLFGWRVVKHVKSNAIVLVQDTETVGIGAGQMSRVDASVLAVWKAGERTKGSVMASDAFFPMRDAVDAAAEAGVTAIIQPGGSKGDPEVIKAANEKNIAMVFTGIRHFRH